MDIVLSFAGGDLPVSSFILSPKGKCKVPRCTVTVSDDEGATPTGSQNY